MTYQHLKCARCHGDFVSKGPTLCDDCISTIDTMSSFERVLDYISRARDPDELKTFLTDLGSREVLEPKTFRSVHQAATGRLHELLEPEFKQLEQIFRTSNIFKSRVWQVA